MVLPVSAMARASVFYINETLTIFAGHKSPTESSVLGGTQAHGYNLIKTNFIQAVWELGLTRRIHYVNLD